MLQFLTRKEPRLELEINAEHFPCVRERKFSAAPLVSAMGTELFFGVPRRSKMDLEQIRASMMITCPLCQAKLSPEEWKRVDQEQVKCAWCGGLFIPQGSQSQRSA